MKIQSVSLFLVLFFNGGYVFSQQVLSGVVTSAEDGFKLPGVNILNQCIGQRTITSPDGKYSIQAEAGDSIIYSFIGMERAAVLFSGEQNRNIALKPVLIELDELVLIGYS
jgi:TonB-dependent starch-binding outer membrane protein SusC